MSAFVVHKRHIDALVAAAIRWKKEILPKMGTPDEVGQALWNENFNSVNYRYVEKSPVPTYTYEPYTLPKPPSVFVLKAVACLRYQSCEHPGWKESAACETLEAIKHAAISALPGYWEAPWGIYS